jgi:hypothetical protein
MNTQELRSSKKVRLWTIGILIAVAVGLLFIVKGTWAKAILGVVIALLVGAFGMEATNNDYDVGKIIETKSFSAAKIERDASGNLVNVDAFCNAQESDYNCADFTTQAEAMSVYNRCKTLGKNMDIYRLDGDKDGLVCESLSTKARAE